MPENRLIASIMFETDDAEVNAGPWLVTLQSGNGTTVTTGPWERADAVEFAEEMAEIEDIPGQVFVEPLFSRPELEVARNFLAENAEDDEDDEDEDDGVELLGASVPAEGRIR